MQAISTDMFVRWFHDPTCTDVTQSGGKGASLARLAAAGLPIPPGFVVTSAAFAIFLEGTGLTSAIRSVLQRLDLSQRRELDRAAAELQSLILNQPLPTELEQAITNAYIELGKGGPVAVAVRSSAVAEDSQQASFAGQQATYLNVCDTSAVLARLRECWGSFFSPRALFYRAQKGSLDDFAFAVVVQQLIFPEKAGVLFTADPVQRRRNILVIEAVWGFGESLVSGEVTPDHYEIERQYGRVLRAIIPAKTHKLIQAEHGGLTPVPIPESQQRAPILDERELFALCTLANQVETIFGNPQDVEWAIENGRLFLLQSRPITTLR